MNEITVNVTQLHIDVGSPCNVGCCPVAMAIDDALGYGGPEDPRAVEIAHKAWRWNDHIFRYGVYQRVRGDFVKIADLPENVCAWIMTFDDEIDVSQISFVLEFTREPR